MENSKTVAVLGASPKADRYSNKAIHRLLENGHTVLPIHPAHSEIDGLKVFNSINEITAEVDTLTMYVSAAHSTPQTDAILQLNPKRVIFNPGTENPELQSKLEAAGIEVMEACTLVLLASNQF